jgi:DNA-binding beta-propeller fold protein YncE
MILIYVCAGYVSLLAGSILKTTGSSDGVATSALFYGPRGIAIDSTGRLWVADSNNNVIRAITSTSPGNRIIVVSDCEVSAIIMMRWIGTVSTIAGSLGSAGSLDGTGTNARFSSPKAIAVDTMQSIFIADLNGIRKLTTSGNCCYISQMNVMLEITCVV